MRRAEIGAVGERIAAWWLADRGLGIIAHNVEVPGGELDLIARDGARRVVIEVRTTTGHGDPIDAIDGGKRRHVSRLAAMVGAARIDFLGVALEREALVIHWVPG